MEISFWTAFKFYFIPYYFWLAVTMVYFWLKVSIHSKDIKAKYAAFQVYFQARSKMKSEEKRRKKISFWGVKIVQVKMEAEWCTFGSYLFSVDDQRRHGLCMFVQPKLLWHCSLSKHPTHTSSYYLLNHLNHTKDFRELPWAGGAIPLISDLSHKPGEQHLKCYWQR